MKDLTTFYETYKALLKQGKSWSDAFREAQWAQDAFDKYIAEQIEASRPQPVDAKTGLQNFTEALNVDQSKQDQSETFYWKPIAQFSEGDAFLDCAGFLIVQSKDGAGDVFTEPHDMEKRGAVKYLARKPKAFVPCWEWDGKQCDVDGIWIMEDSSGFFFRSCIGSGNSSAYYPTLEAAQLEAERYYRLYIEPNLK